MLQRLGHPMAANAEDVVDGRQQNEGEEGDEGQQKQLAMA
jgi:hypothetical protein